MKKSDSIEALAAALAKFHSAVGPILKNKNVSYGKTSFEYADLTSIWDAIRKPLSAAGLSILQTFDDFKLITTLLHESGQYISSEMGLGVSPNADHKAVGGAITYIRRYMLVSVLSLAADDEEGEDPKSSIAIASNSKEVSFDSKEEDSPSQEEIQNLERLIDDEGLVYKSNLLEFFCSKTGRPLADFKTLNRKDHDSAMRSVTRNKEQRLKSKGK